MSNGLKIGLAVGISSVVIIIFAYFIYRWVKKPSINVDEVDINKRKGKVKVGGEVFEVGNPKVKAKFAKINVFWDATVSQNGDIKLHRFSKLQLSKNVFSENQDLKSSKPENISAPSAPTALAAPSGQSGQSSSQASDPVISDKEILKKMQKENPDQWKVMMDMKENNYPAYEEQMKKIRPFYYRTEKPTTTH